VGQAVFIQQDVAEEADWKRTIDEISVEASSSSMAA